MGDPVNLRNFAWALTTMLEVVLLFYLLRRKLYRSHPAFFIYILAVILQSIVMAAANRHWGFQSIQSWNIYWSSQAVVIGARWYAVAEIARKVLADYAGLWGMASRILFALSVCVLVYSFAFSRYRWTLMVLNADRAVELCIGTFIVCMFLFARYYRLPMADPERQLAIGFCLYSFSWVINDSILENWLGSLWDFLNYVNVFAFLASLLLWISAVRKRKETEGVTVPAPVSPETYEKLSLEATARLHLLNERLNHLLRTEDSRP
jgi:hypothetical protein